MLNPTVLLTLVLKKMIYDNPRKVRNPVLFLPALCTKAKMVEKAPQSVEIDVFTRILQIQP